MASSAGSVEGQRFVWLTLTEKFKEEIMLLTSGPIDEKTETLGLVFAMGASVAEGCSDQINAIAAYQNANNELKKLAKEMNADAIVCINYQNRNAVSNSCGSRGKQVFEVYAWGTAVRFVKT